MKFAYVLHGFTVKKKKIACFMARINDFLYQQGFCITWFPLFFKKKKSCYNKDLNWLVHWFRSNEL